MSEKSTVDRYVEHINRHILQSIDYAKLQKSYDTDMVYAKEILNRLHEAMVNAYGHERLDEYAGDEDGFVVIPGIVRGKESGKIGLALLDLDLSSSGEHWGTSFLCEFGVISQTEDKEDHVAKTLSKRFAPYDYCYTATIPGDIHIHEATLPDELKAVLRDFRNNKPSVLEGIRETATALKNTEQDKTPQENSEPEL